jgi:two-component system, LuxR family, response regulator FixJ
VNPVSAEDRPVIAIIDDDSSMRRSLVRVVESAGYIAKAFAGGREFFDWLASGSAACLVIDVYMDEMSGFEVQERVGLPVIFITAHDDTPTRARLARTGASHLHKPFPAASLVEAIRHALHPARESAPIDGTQAASDIDCV